MSDHELWNEVGNLYFKSGAYDLAINAYARAIALDAAFGKPYANLGLVNTRLEKYADAILLYKKALELLAEPFDKAFAWYRLGNTYWEIEEYTLAMESFRKADGLILGHQRDLVASPEMILTNRQGVDEVLTILDLPEDDVPSVEPTSFVASASDFGRDAYLDDIASWTFKEYIMPDEEPLVPDTEWMPLDEADDVQPNEEVIVIEPLKWEVSAEAESREETPVVQPVAVDTEAVEASINLPDAIVQEFALESAVAKQASETEMSIPEIETPVAMVEESEVIPFPVTVDEPAMVNEEEPRLVILESHLAGVVSVEIETVEVIDSGEETPAAAEVNEAVEEIPAAEIESEPMIIIADESETAQFVEEVNEVVMSEIAVALIAEVNEVEVPVEVAEPVEMEVEALPVMEIQPESEVVTQAPEFIAEDVTDPEPIQYETPTVESSLDDSAAVWKEIHRVKHVLEINPQNARAWDAMGGLYKSIGHYQQAIDAFQEAVALEPTKAIYVQRLALAFAADGRMDEAATSFEQAIELNPENSLAHATLGAYYRRQGRDELAHAHIERARGLLDAEENEYNRACLEAICGNSDRALDLLEIALKNKQTYTTWVRRDPDLDFIRNDARFDALLAEYEVSNA